VLLHAFVQVALDPTEVGIGGQDESFAGCSQLRDLGAQSLECFAQRLVLLSLQSDGPPGSVEEVVRHRTGGVKQTSTPATGETAPKPSRVVEGPAPDEGGAASWHIRLPPP
jgi:hypothetical protein